MTKRKNDVEDDGFTVGAIERGLAEFATGGKKKRAAKKKSLFDKDIDRVVQRDTDRTDAQRAGSFRSDMAPKTDASGRRLSIWERMEARRKQGATSARRTAVDVPESDDFKTRKVNAKTKAESLGHTMSKWAKRGDRYGREDAHCTTCDDSVTVCVTPPSDYNLPVIYGDAVTRVCTSKHS